MLSLNLKPHTYIYRDLTRNPKLRAAGSSSNIVPVSGSAASSGRVASKKEKKSGEISWALGCRV